MDIVNWKSPTFTNISKEFDVHAIPYIRIYGPNRELILGKTTTNIAEIEEAVKSHTKAK